MKTSIFCINKESIGLLIPERQNWKRSRRKSAKKKMIKLFTNSIPLFVTKFAPIRP